MRSVSEIKIDTKTLKKYSNRSYYFRKSRFSAFKYLQLENSSYASKNIRSGGNTTRQLSRIVGSSIKQKIFEQLLFPRN